MAERRNLVLGTAGHIDHGKTALVKALTGVDTDRLPAEKQRGITIDLGFAALDLGDTQLALVDVPGHERFIRNMLAGASGLDLAMLVVAADDSVMPQTREHLEILQLLGLNTGVIVLTKCDLSDPTWLPLVEDEVRTVTDGTFLEHAPIVRTSAVTGLGIDALKQELGRISATLRDPHDVGLFRMAIDRAFTVPGHGTVVTGTVASGTVAVGDELAWLPDDRKVRVRGLQRHDQPVERAGRGTRAAINLVGVHHSEIRRGQELGSPDYLEAARILSVDLRVSELASRMLRHRGRYRLHLGTAEVAATLSLLGRNELGVEQTCLGQLFLAEPVAAVYGQPFILRAESPAETLGGGRVLQPSARRVRRRDALSIERLDRLRALDPNLRLAAVLALRGLAPSTDRALCRMTGIALGELPCVVEAMSAAGHLVELPLGPRRSVRVVAEFATELEDRVLRALGRLHAERPRQSAIPRSHVVAALPDIANDALIGAVLDRLMAKNEIVATARAVEIRGHEPKLSQAERRLKAELAETIRTAVFSPPDLADLAAMAGPRAEVVAELLALLRDEQRIVEIAPHLFLDIDAEAELRRRVVERLGGGALISMADLRDLLGTTRKYAVPIGEYLDRVGITQREGDLRRLGSLSPPTANPG